MKRLSILSAAAGLVLTAASAMAETPTALRDVSTLVHDLVVSKPYATPNNFTKKVVYPPENTALVGTCHMTESAALKLEAADAYLKANSNGNRLVALDCYRPAEAQTLLWNAWGCPANPAKCSGYIAQPGKSRHNRGAAFDGTLADKEGNPLEMPTPYDTFTNKAHPASSNSWTEEAKKNWYLYNAAMTNAGCKNNPSEWWHYDC